MTDHEHEWTSVQVSDLVAHRTCACGVIEEDVFVSQGHTVTIAQSANGGLIWSCTCSKTGSTSRREQAFAHAAQDTSGHGADEDGVVVADAGHTFRISVQVRGSSRVYGEAHHRDDPEWDPIPNAVEVRAWNLHDALLEATKLPLDDWFFDEGDDE